MRAYPEQMIAECFGVLDELVKGGARLRVWELSGDDGGYWMAQIEEVIDGQKYGNLCHGPTHQDAVTALGYHLGRRGVARG